MTQNDAHDRGFIKAATDYGYTYGQAIDLLNYSKQANVVTPQAPGPKQARFNKMVQQTAQPTQQKV